MVWQMYTCILFRWEYIVTFPWSRVDKIVFYNIILSVVECSFCGFTVLFDQFPIVGFFTFLLKLFIALLGDHHISCFKSFKK